MAQIINGQYTYTGEEKLPTVGSPEYNLAQNDPVSLQNFKTANPTLTFTGTDLNKYNQAIPPTGKPVSITAESLGATNPITLPQPQNTAGTAAQAVIGGSQAGLNTLGTIQAEQQAKANEAIKANEKLNPLLQGVASQLGSRGDIQQKLEDESGVGVSRELARNLTQEYQTKQLQYNKVMESIFNDPRQTSEQKAQAFDQINRTHAFDLTDLSIRQNIATGNYQALQDSVDKRVNLLYGDIKDKYTYLKDWYDENKADLTKAEDNKLQLQIKSAEEETKKADDLKKTINTLLISANGQNAPSNVIESIAKATTEKEAIQAAGQYAVDQLDRMYKQAQIDKLNAEAKKALEGENMTVVSDKLNGLTQTGDPVSNKAAISAILSGKAVSAGTKGRLAPANSVLNAVDEFASQRPEGEFVGMGVFGRAKEFYKGLVNMKDPRAIENMQNVDAINLKVQQWASGASLTEQQTKQVNKMTPKSGDSDKVIRTKLNGLYNYMLNQVEADLLTDGVNINFKPVNLFETRDLLSGASPEQLSELKEAGLIE